LCSIATKKSEIKKNPTKKGKYCLGIAEGLEDRIALENLLFHLLHVLALAGNGCDVFRVSGGQKQNGSYEGK
jgi:hypothetical protein